MFVLAFVVSLLVTLSLASPSVVGRYIAFPNRCIQTDKNFTLTAVYKADTSIQKPLALGSNVLPNSVGWIGVGIFVIPLHNDCTDTRYILQSAESMNHIISSNFNINKGGLTAITPENLTTGVSQDVPMENGLLKFFLATDTEMHASVEGVYCERVRTENRSLL